jgi:hypothetical protein
MFEPHVVVHVQEHFVGIAGVVGLQIIRDDFWMAAVFHDITPCSLRFLLFILPMTSDQ